MPTDIVALTHDVWQQLAPFAPMLSGTVQGAVQEIGRQLGDQAARLPARLWERLGPKVQARPAALAALEAAADRPEDGQRHTVLLQRLQQLLQEDPALAQDLARLLGDGPVITQGPVFEAGSSVQAVNVAGSQFIREQRIGDIFGRSGGGADAE
jgi:hypothetical protein